MKLSLPAIIENLSETFSIVDSRVTNDTNYIEDVYFASAPFKERKNALYIYADFLETSFVPVLDSTAILCIGALPESFKRKSLDYVCLSDDADPSLVFNSVSLLLSELRAWEAEIYDMFVTGKSLQEIFDITTEFTNNPIYLHDRDYRILYYSEKKINRALQKSYSFLKEAKMPPEAILGLLKSPNFEKTFLTERATYWEKTSIYPDEYNYIYCNIKIDNVFFGRIFMDERNQPFRMIDYVIVDKLAELVTKLFRVKKIATDYQLDFMANSVNALLENTLTNHTEFTAALSEMAWNVNDRYICITVPLAKGDITRHVAGSVLNMIERAFSQCYTIEHKSSIVAILNCENTAMSRSLLCMQLFPILRDFRLKAFVSRDFYDIFELPEHYRLNLSYQAAVSSGAKGEPEESIYFFEDYTLQFILNTLLSNARPEMLYPRPLQELIAFDRENNTDFTATLRAYLENDCSPANASQALYIHRSTFRYRMEKIEEILGTDFSDAALKTHLLLSFLLMDELNRNG